MCAKVFANSSLASIINIPLPESDFTEDDIKKFLKPTRQGKVAVPYIPQYRILQWLRENFGAGLQLIEEDPPKVLTIGTKQYVLRHLQVKYPVEIEGQLEWVTLDAYGTSEIQRGDFIRALHGARSNALKEIIKGLAKGLSIFEQADGEEVDILDYTNAGDDVFASQADEKPKDAFDTTTTTLPSGSAF